MNYRVGDVVEACIPDKVQWKEVTVVRLNPLTIGDEKRRLVVGAPVIVRARGAEE